MKTTRTEARRILRRVYPDMQIYITGRLRIANIPVVNIQLGEPVLAWRALKKRSPIALALDPVEIGRVRNPLLTGEPDIDWSWNP